MNLLIQYNFLIYQHPNFEQASRTSIQKDQMYFTAFGRNRFRSRLILLYSRAENVKCQPKRGFLWLGAPVLALLQMFEKHAEKQLFLMHFLVNRRTTNTIKKSNKDLEQRRLNSARKIKCILLHLQETVLEVFLYYYIHVLKNS